MRKDTFWPLIEKCRQESVNDSELFRVTLPVVVAVPVVGFLTLPLLVDAAPVRAFAGAGLLLLTAAVTTALAGRRIRAARTADMPTAEPVPAPEPVGMRVS